MINKPYRLFFIPKPRLIAALLALWVLQLWAMPADAGEENPLKPIDTSSPRATLQGFLEFMNNGYTTGSRKRRIVSGFHEALPVARGNSQHQRLPTLPGIGPTGLDLSELPPSMVTRSARRLAIQLKEVLDRIDLPPIESIPDAQAMVKSEFKRWTLPNSEIRIQRVEKGPRTGEYLFTPETFDSPAGVLRQGQRPSLQTRCFRQAGMTSASYSPAGVALALHRIVPPRWLIDAPRHRTRTTFLDQPVWRWFGIVAVLGAGLAFVLLCFRLSRYWTSRATSSGQWASLLRPISLMIVTPVAALILSQILRISGSVYQAVTSVAVGPVLSRPHLGGLGGRRRDRREPDLRGKTTGQAASIASLSAWSCGL